MQHYHPLPFGLIQHLDWYLGELLMRPWRQNVPYVATRIRNIFVRSYRLTKAIITQDISKFYDTQGTTAAIMQQVKTANSQAWNHYVPRPYPGKLTLLGCSETPTRCYRDRRLAWSEVAEGGLEVHVIPGNHLTMVEPPQVDVMAQILLHCLRAAQAEDQSHHPMAAFA